MNLYRKLDCVCGHAYAYHDRGYCEDLKDGCNQYDPAGHNPEIENVLCPRCRLARLEKFDDRTYICFACQYVMLESQVLRIVG